MQVWQWDEGDRGAPLQVLHCHPVQARIVDALARPASIVHRRSILMNRTLSPILMTCWLAAGCVTSDAEELDPQELVRVRVEIRERGEEIVANEFVVAEIIDGDGETLDEALASALSAACLINAWDDLCALDS